MTQHEWTGTSYAEHCKNCRAFRWDADAEEACPNPPKPKQSMGGPLDALDQAIQEGFFERIDRQFKKKI